MQRTLYLSSIPQPLLQQLANSYHFRAIAPAPQAARALQVPHQNLKTFAQKLFRTNGLTIAPPLTAYRTPNGLALLDYKTSSTKPAGVKNALGKAELDIQLSIYMDVVGTLFPDETVTDAYYYSLKTHKLSRTGRDEAALAAFAERVKSHLEMGHYPVEPDIDRNACRTCPFDLVCRKGTRLSRKQQSLELQHESDD